MKGRKRIEQRKVYDSLTRGFDQCSIIICPDILLQHPMRNWSDKKKYKLKFDTEFNYFDWFCLFMASLLGKCFNIFKTSDNIIWLNLWEFSILLLPKWIHFNLSSQKSFMLRIKRVVRMKHIELDWIPLKAKIESILIFCTYNSFQLSSLMAWLIVKII